MIDSSWKRIRAAGLFAHIRGLEDYQQRVLPRMAIASRILESGIWQEPKWSASVALLLHRTIFEEVHPWAGSWRKNGQSVTIGGKIPADPQSIRFEMELLGRQMDWLMSRSKDHSRCILAVAFHHARFESIHPFLDGNGRTGRVITAGILLNCAGLKLDLGIILKNGRENYIQALKDAKVNLHPLAEILAQGCGVDVDLNAPKIPPFRVPPRGEPIDEHDLLSNPTTEYWENCR